MADSNPYKPTGEIPEAEPPEESPFRIICKMIVLFLSVPLAIGSMAAAYHLFLFAFYKDSTSDPWGKANTPYLVAFLTSPLVVILAALSPILRPRFRIRTWMILILVWLTPAALLLLSFPIVDYYHDDRIYTSPGSGMPDHPTFLRDEGIYSHP